MGSGIEACAKVGALVVAAMLAWGLGAALGDVIVKRVLGRCVACRRALMPWRRVCDGCLDAATDMSRECECPGVVVLDADHPWYCARCGRQLAHDTYRQLADKARTATVQATCPNCGAWSGDPHRDGNRYVGNVCPGASS